MAPPMEFRLIFRQHVTHGMTRWEWFLLQIMAALKIPMGLENGWTFISDLRGCYFIDPVNGKRHRCHSRSGINLRVTGSSLDLARPSTRFLSIQLETQPD
ncbi:hypothetical protein NC651_031544 [Populus alba x Populus x berolinensis]|nr:hypothetical protein NC651_031544 [Populus alba x Populus x berolinensis]